MNQLGKLFLKGLIVVLPIVLTISLVWWLILTAETTFGGYLHALLPEGWYIPGMGLVVAVVFTAFIGLLSHWLIFQKVFELGDRLIKKVPLVKSIYSALRDFASYFNPGEERKLGRVVAVKLPGQQFQLIGFVTQEKLVYPQLEALAENTSEHLVAVYLPMSYQIGGYTLYLPENALTALDLSIEEALKLTLTGGAGISVAENSKKPVD